MFRLFGTLLSNQCVLIIFATFFLQTHRPLVERRRWIDVPASMSQQQGGHHKHGAECYEKFERQELDAG